MNEGTCCYCGEDSLFDARCRMCGDFVLFNEDRPYCKLDDDGTIWHARPGDRNYYSERVKCKCGNDKLEVEWLSTCRDCGARS
jgi:hypothetical protein